MVSISCPADGSSSVDGSSLADGNNFADGSLTDTDMAGAHRGLLEYLVGVGIERCQARVVLPSQLPSDAPKGRNVVLAAGKAAAEMLAVADECLKGETHGLAVTRYGHGARDTAVRDVTVADKVTAVCKTARNVAAVCKTIEAGHPLPDENSLRAADAMLSMAAATKPDDRLLFMFSGGGSALLCAPIDGVSIEQKRQITQFLLHRGARIDEINLVRKHLSRIKGGALAACAPALQMFTYVISDIVGDDPASVASAPSIGGAGDAGAALRILETYGWPDVDAVAAALRRHKKRPAPAHPVTVLAAAKTAIDAVARAADKKGWTPLVIGEDIQGDAAATGRAHADIARREYDNGRRCALISGGELTVRVNNDAGAGGANLEYLTSLMIHLRGAPGIEAIACDSDGIDGTEDNAGGYICATSLARAAAQHVDPRQALADNNTYHLFAALGDLIVTGPTRTNVNDIRIILINPAEKGDSGV